VLVEAAIAVIIILGVGLGGYWISSVVSRYHQIEEAVAAAARYGARNEYNPQYPSTCANGVCSTRRRTANEIVTYATCAAHLDPKTTHPCPNWPENGADPDAGSVAVQVFCAPPTPPGSSAKVNDSAFTKCPLPDDPTVSKTTYGPEDRVHWPPGSYLKVKATLTMGSDNPIIALGRGINGIFSSLGMGKPFPDQMHLTDASVAIIE